MYRDLISSGEATGDGTMVDALVGLRARTTPIVSAALIDLRRDPPARTAALKTVRPPSLRGAPLRLPVDESRFEIGSVTKALTGMLLADAVDRGELTLASPVATIASELADAPIGEATIAQLCTHTSGLPRLPGGARTAGRGLWFALAGANPYRGLGREDVLAAAAAQRLERRGAYRYSNLGGALAGQLLAIAAGRGYATLLRERILTPIGMPSTGVSFDEDVAAPGHSGSGRQRRPWAMGGYAPAGGVYSTIDDIAALAIALLREDAPGRRSLEPLPDVAPSATGRGAGMFWIVEPSPDPSGEARRMIWHNGQTGGYSAFLALLPVSGQAVAVLANVARSAEQRRTALGLMKLL